MNTTIQPTTAKDLIANQKLVNSMTKTDSNDEIKRLLLEHGLTETQINDLMNPTTPLAPSTLEKVSGGLKLPESISKSLDYAKQHPLKTASKVITTLSAIATPILIGYSTKKLNKHLNELTTTQPQTYQNIESAPQFPVLSDAYVKEES